MNEEVFNWDEFMDLCQTTRYETVYEPEQKDFIRTSLFSWFNEKEKEGCTISIAQSRLDYSSTTYFPDSSYSYRYGVDEVMYYSANLGRIDSQYRRPSVETLINGEKILLLRKNNDFVVGEIIYKPKETDKNSVDYIKLETVNKNINFMMIDTELTDHFFDMLEYALVCLMD